MSNGTFNLDEWRRTSIGIREGELALQEIQTRLRREHLEGRLQTQQMWIDDGLGWVEEEQLRLDGAESSLTESLSRLEQERCQVDQEDGLLEDAQTRLDEVLAAFRQHFAN